MSNSPFHNPQSDPLPDANDIDREFQTPSDRPENARNVPISHEAKTQLESDKRKLRNLVIALLAIGLIVGGILSIGLVWTLDRFGLSDPPAAEQQ